MRGGRLQRLQARQRHVGRHRWRAAFTPVVEFSLPIHRLCDRLSLSLHPRMEDNARGPGCYLSGVAVGVAVFEEWRKVVRLPALQAGCQECGGDRGEGGNELGGDAAHVGVLSGIG
jgi:hypothetical protein